VQPLKKMWGVDQAFCGHSVCFASGSQEPERCAKQTETWLLARDFPRKGGRCLDCETERRATWKREDILSGVFLTVRRSERRPR
jgi:hypothetical protein